MGIKLYLVTHPDGFEEKVTNMNAFCKQHGLIQSSMSKVANGVTTHHQGFLVKIISANENTELELLRRRKNEKILDMCKDLVQTPYSKLTFEQKNDLILNLYAIEKIFGELK